jgi:hypothetical protein
VFGRRKQELQQRRRARDEYKSATSGDPVEGEREWTYVYDTDISKPPCEKHNPDFRPGQVESLAPRQPSSFCADCRREQLKRKRHTGSNVEVVPDSRTSSFGWGQDGERVGRALDGYDQRLEESPSYVAPNSIEEGRALEIINAGREEERRTSRRGGRVYIERIEGGDLVQYVKSGRGGGLIRVEPRDVATTTKRSAVIAVRRAA